MSADVLVWLSMLTVTRDMINFGAKNPFEMVLILSKGRLTHFKMGVTSQSVQAGRSGLECER